MAAGLCATPRDWPFSSCGAGFQPAEELQFIDPRKTPFAPIKGRGELPHLHKEGGTYFVTFRLLDAVDTNLCGAGFQPATHKTGKIPARSHKAGRMLPASGKAGKMPALQEEAFQKWLHSHKPFHWFVEGRVPKVGGNSGLARPT